MRRAIKLLNHQKNILETQDLIFKSYMQKGFIYSPYKFLEMDKTEDLSNFFQNYKSHISQDINVKEYDDKKVSFSSRKNDKEHTMLFFDTENLFPEFTKDILQIMIDNTTKMMDVTDKNRPFDWRLLIHEYNPQDLLETDLSPRSDFFKYSDYGEYLYIVTFGGERVLQACNDGQMKNFQKKGPEFLLIPGSELLLNTEAKNEFNIRIKPTIGKKFKVGEVDYEKKKSYIMMFFGQ